MIRAAGHLLAVLALTALSQLGGLAWLFALAFRRRWVAFALAYAALWGAAMLPAPLSGRVPLPCFGAPLAVQSPLISALNRHYVTPELLTVAEDLAATMAARHPGTITLALDASFPFFQGFPLLPHISHDDGEKFDLAFYYTDATGTYLPRRTRSPLGYFAFEDGPTDCASAFPTLRWNFALAQSLYPDRPLDPARTRDAVALLIAGPRVARILLEPHLARRLSLAAPKLRFQGCRAARHDDHIHIQL